MVRYCCYFCSGQFQNSFYLKLLLYRVERGLMFFLQRDFNLYDENDDKVLDLDEIQRMGQASSTYQSSF